MKKILFLFAAFILSVSIFIMIIQPGKPGYMTAEAVQKAFAAAKAQAASSEIYIRGTIKAGNGETNREQHILTNLIRQAGGNTEALKPVFFTFENDTGIGTESDYIIDDNKSINVRIMSNTQREVSAKYKDIFVSMTDTSRKPELPAMVKALTEAMESYGIHPDISICITGSIDGKLCDEELEALCDRIFKSMRADRVEGIKDGGLVSVSAFSPAIEDAVRVNGKRVNLNVAIRYNSYEGKTYIWLATPVITMEY